MVPQGGKMAGGRLIPRPKDLALLLTAVLCAGALFFALSKGFIKKNDEINILVMGIDTASGWRARSDSINLVHINYADRRIGILAIPRDTLVDIPGYGQDKINHAHMYGGPELSCLTVSNFLKVPVHYYIDINFPLFMNLVDSIGGVTVDVEKPLYYSDNAGSLHINLRAGPQRLSGYQAMGYVRFRHDNASDWGRIDRQHKFFQALVREVSKPSNLWKTPLLAYGVSSNIRTNLGPMQVLKLAMGASSIYRNGRVDTGTIPGGGARLARGYFILTDEAGKQKVINEVIFGRK